MRAASAVRMQTSVALSRATQAINTPPGSEVASAGKGASSVDRAHLRRGASHGEPVAVIDARLTALGASLLYDDGRVDYVALSDVDGRSAAYARAALRHEADIQAENAICECRRALRPRPAVEKAEAVVLSVEQWAVADAYALHGAATASHYFVNYGLARDAGRRVTVRPCVLRAAPGARCCC